jgi:hypothetical protein
MESHEENSKQFLELRLMASCNFEKEKYFKSITNIFSLEQFLSFKFSSNTTTPTWSKFMLIYNMKSILFVHHNSIIETHHIYVNLGWF